ncbi:MAG: hypothetical protein GY928_34710 [Colwellia sp.]|nr:hypothetical protein [Colwellia sp.]
MKKIVNLLLFVLLMHSQSVIAGTIVPEKRALIEKLVGQTEESVLAIGDQLTKDYIQQLTTILQDMEWVTDWKKSVILEEEAKKDVHGILDAYIKLLDQEYQIYDKHFTIEELKQVIELKDTTKIGLNKTLIGNKFTKIMRLISQKIEQYEQAFSETESPHIIQRIFTRRRNESYPILLDNAKAVFSQTFVAGTITPEKRALIEKLVEQTEESVLAKEDQMSKNYIKLVTKIIKTNDPYIDPGAFVILEEEARKYVHGALETYSKFLEMKYQVYNKHFTIEELKQLIELKNTTGIELKKTRLGKKLIKIRRLISQKIEQCEQTFLYNEFLYIIQPEWPFIIQSVYARLVKETIKSNLLLHEAKSYNSQPVISGSISPKKRALIDKLCKQSGKSDIEIGNQLSKAFIKKNTNYILNIYLNYVPRMLILMEEEIEKFINDEVVVKKRFSKKIYPVYDKYFMIEELKQIIFLKDLPEIELKKTHSVKNLSM